MLTDIVVQNPGSGQPLLALAIYRAASGESDDAGMLIAQALSRGAAYPS